MTKKFLFTSAIFLVALLLALSLAPFRPAAAQSVAPCPDNVSVVIS